MTKNIANLKSKNMKWKDPLEPIEEVSLSIIHDSVCEFFKINNKNDIFIRSRKRYILIPRQWFHYFAVLLNPRYNISYAFIGNYNSSETKEVYDHATVIHSKKTIDGYIDVYDKCEKIEKLIKDIIDDKRDVCKNETIKQGNCVETTFDIIKPMKQKV